MQHAPTENVKFFEKYSLLFVLSCLLFRKMIVLAKIVRVIVGQLILHFTSSIGSERIKWTQKTFQRSTVILHKRSLHLIYNLKNSHQQTQQQRSVFD